MPRNENIEAEGVVIEAMRGTTFKIKLSNGHIITATLSGKLRVHYIRVMPGDHVKIEMSPYDITKGRITWRGKGS